MSYGGWVTTLSLPAVRMPGEQLQSGLARAAAGLAELRLAFLTLVSVLLARTLPAGTVARHAAVPVRRPVVRVVPAAAGLAGGDLLGGLGGPPPGGGLRLPSLRSLVLPAVLLAEFLTGVAIGYFT